MSSTAQLHLHLSSSSLILIHRRHLLLACPLSQFHHAITVDPRSLANLQQRSLLFASSPSRRCFVVSSPVAAALPPPIDINFGLAPSRFWPPPRHCCCCSHSIANSLLFLASTSRCHLCSWPLPSTAAPSEFHQCAADRPRVVAVQPRIITLSLSNFISLHSLFL